MSSDLKVTNIKHESSSSNNLVLASDGNVSLSGTLSAGTLGSSVAFPSGKIIKTYGDKTPVDVQKTIDGAFAITEIGISPTGVTSGNKLVLLLNGSMAHDGSASSSNFTQVYVEGTTSSSGLGQTTSGVKIANNFGRYSTANVYWNYSVILITDAVTASSPVYRLYQQRSGGNWTMFFNGWTFTALEIQG